MCVTRAYYARFQKGENKMVSNQNANQIKIDELKPVYKGLEDTDFKSMLERIASEYKDEDAFIVKHKQGKEVSYEHISFIRVKEDTFALGTAMLRKGFKGKNIAIIGNNRYEWVISYLAVMGGIGYVVPLDKGLPYEEVESSIERSYADVLIFDYAHKDIADTLKASGKTKVTEYICMNVPDGRKADDTAEAPYYSMFADLVEEGKALIAGGNAEFASLPVDAEESSILLFTSGTTSMSKAVMLSQKNILSNIAAMSLVEDIRRGDVNMAFLPYHHTFGSTAQIYMLEVGATTTYCDGLKYLQKNIVEYKVSVFVCVPLLIESVYKKIMNKVEKEGKTKTVKFGIKLSKFLLKFGIDIRRKLFKEIHEQLGGNLRFVISGAAAIDPEALEGFINFGIEAVQGYGMTESAPVLAAENLFERKSGSIGKSLPGVELRIDEPNEEGIGELIGRGPNVMEGYFENEEETAKTLQDGWLHTGDLARIDKDGYIFLCGRKKNVIVLRNGKNVYPEELEVLIAALPYVEENMVFGEEKRAGSGDHDLALAAKIVYKKDAMRELYGAETAEEVEKVIRRDIDEINQKLPTYKQMQRLVITDEPMIKTTTGKVKRFEEQKNL